MADWTFANLSTARVGIASTSYQEQTTSVPENGIVPSVGTRTFQESFGSSFTEITQSRTYQRGKRPGTGQLFPRGVYNK